jgi:hypothetical protein
VLNPDFRDILSAFIEKRVEFIVVGAYALAAQGLPRATGDIDLWVRASPENKAVGRPQDIADLQRLDSLDDGTEERD